jgi:hypothetical protein
MEGKTDAGSIAQGYRQQVYLATRFSIRTSTFNTPVASSIYASEVLLHGKASGGAARIDIELTIN